MGRFAASLVGYFAKVILEIFSTTEQTYSWRQASEHACVALQICMHAYGSWPRTMEMAQHSSSSRIR